MKDASMAIKIGSLLRSIRSEQSITQFGLAKKTELDYRHLQTIEAGKVDLRIKTLARLCAGLGIEIPAFFERLRRQ